MARVSPLFGAGCGLAFYLFFTDGAPAEALTPQRVFGRYQQQVWTDEDGLAQNTVLWITQDREGYLWLGTMGGVARFDGVRFTSFDAINTPELSSDLINTVLPEADGGAWIGTEAGPVRRDADGKFTRVTEPERITSRHGTRFARDTAGNLWAAKAGTGLFRWRDGRFEVVPLGYGPLGDEIYSIISDGAGGLWLGCMAALIHWKEGRSTIYTAQQGLPPGMLRALCLDRAGNLWIGTMGGGLSRFRDGVFTPLGAGDGMPSDQVWALIEDGEGALWIGTGGGGVYRMKDGRFDAFTPAEGLVGDRVCSLFESTEGDIWIGTDGGLTRLREGRFQVYTTKDGLAHDFAFAVYEDRAGALWAGSTEGVTRFQNGASTVFREAEGSAPLGEITALGEDAAGDLWIGAANGLNCLRAGHFVPEPLPTSQPTPSIASILGSRDGALLVATRGAGAWMRRAEKWEPLSLPTAWERINVTAFYEDRAGNLWAGTHNGGVGRRSREPRSAAGSASATPLSDGGTLPHDTTSPKAVSPLRSATALQGAVEQDWQVWTMRDGLAADYAVSFHEDAEGAMWVGTFGGGLSRWKDGRWTSVAARQGLFDNIIFQILPDAAGNLWMGCNRGLFRVPLRELNACANGRVPSVTSYAYGLADGLPARECNSARPAGWRTRDDRLFFPTTRGLVSFSAHAPALRPPHVLIQQVRLERVPVSIRPEVRVQPGQNDLEIEYTALSWNRPAQIRFQYRLDGLDRAWTEAGTRRSVNYTHLPAGSYTFRLRADNGEGVWSETDATLGIIVRPPFWRTWWFLSLGALALLAAILGSFRLRVQQMQRKQAAQENFSRRLMNAHETERRRIAAELHDSLGQSLAMIKNSAVFGAQGAGDPATAQAQFERITEQSAHAISEVREISYDLRPYMLDQFGLAKAIRSLLDKIADSTALKVKTAIDDVSGLFPAEVEMSLYRIVQESLNNILKHAEATEVEVTMKKTGSSVQLEIRDNGKGFNARPTVHMERSGFGLLGISERVRLLGGTHTLRSSPGHGATVEITLECGGKR